MDTINYLNLEYLYYLLYKTIIEGDLSASGLIGTLFLAWSWFAIFSFIISAILLCIFLYAKRRKAEIEAIIEAKYHTEGVTYDKEKKNVRWEQILLHVASENPNDWRLAIIEADIILDEMVKSMGYAGASLGERLKRIEQSDFTSIEAAWEAHKVRNRIAHSGSDFILTQREARRIISLYEQVFREFEYL